MSFKVLEPKFGHEFEVEDGETVLEAAMRQGVGLPYGCRNGACGKCAGELVKGSVDYGDAEIRSAAKEQLQNGKTLFCQAKPLSDLVIHVREIVKSIDLEVLTMPCRVEKMELLTHDIMKLQLKIPEAKRLQFFAGQYLDILLKDSKRRAFSMANPPHDDEYIELHIRHVPDGHFGDFVFDGMEERTMLRIEAPLGSFYLREDSERPVIMMGGGTGFAPIKGMIEHAFHIGIERPIHLFCGVRALRDLYMDELANSWQQLHSQFQYTPVLSEPGIDDNWTGKQGYVHEEVVQQYPDLANYDVYMSGPPPMVKAGMDAFYDHGLSEDQIYSDSFEYSDDALRAMGIRKPGG